jgi:hypothetical protein
MGSVGLIGPERYTAPRRANIEEFRSESSRVCFGEFEADLSARELRRKGVKIPLQQQPFQVLAALLERPGQLIARDEIRRLIWSTDTFVDFERGWRGEDIGFCFRSRDRSIQWPYFPLRTCREAAIKNTGRME